MRREHKEKDKAHANIVKRGEERKVNAVTGQEEKAGGSKRANAFSVRGVPVGPVSAMKALSTVVIGIGGVGKGLGSSGANWSDSDKGYNGDENVEFEQRKAYVHPFKTILVRGGVDASRAAPPCSVAPIEYAWWSRDLEDLKDWNLALHADKESSRQTSSYEQGYNGRVFVETDCGGGVALDQFAMAIRQAVNTTTATGGQPEKGEILRKPWNLETKGTYTWYPGFDIAHGVSYVHPLVMKGFRPVCPVYHVDSPRVKSAGPLSRLPRMDPTKDYLRASLQYIRLCAVQAGVLPSPPIEAQKLVARQFQQYEVMLDRIRELRKRDHDISRGPMPKNMRLKNMVGNQSLLLSPLMFSPRHLLVGQDPERFCERERAMRKSSLQVMSPFRNVMWGVNPSEATTLVNKSMPVVALYDRGLSPQSLVEGRRRAKLTDLPPPYKFPRMLSLPHERKIIYRDHAQESSSPARSGTRGDSRNAGDGAPREIRERPSTIISRTASTIEEIRNYNSEVRKNERQKRLRAVMGEEAWAEQRRRREEHRILKETQYKITKKFKDALGLCHDAARNPLRYLMMSQVKLWERLTRLTQIVRMQDTMKGMVFPANHYRDASAVYACHQESSKGYRFTPAPSKEDATKRDEHVDKGNETQPSVLCKTTLLPGPVLSSNLGLKVPMRDEALAAKGIEALQSFAETASTAIGNEVTLAGSPATANNNKYKNNNSSRRHAQVRLHESAQELVHQDSALCDQLLLHPDELQKWIQCLACNKWRRIPYHMPDNALPEHWVCASNVWDPDRASCFVPQTMTDEQIDDILARQEGLLAASRNQQVSVTPCTDRTQTATPACDNAATTAPRSICLQLTPGQQVPEEALRYLTALTKPQFLCLVENFNIGHAGKFKTPIFGKQPLDLHRVWWSVVKAGGYKVVCDDKLWRSVAKSLDIDITGRTSASTAIRTHYERCLMAFENYLCSGQFVDDIVNNREPTYTHLTDPVTAGDIIPGGGQASI